VEKGVYETAVILDKISQSMAINTDRSFYSMLSRIPSLAVAALLLAGCESGNQTNQDPSRTGAQPGSATTTPLDPARPSEMVRSESGGDALGDGALEIEILDTGVAITANAVSQQTILYTLATQAGFDITYAGVPWEVVTLTIEAENLHAALVELLKQHPYQIIYEFDTNRQADTLTRVVVGDPLAGRERIQSAPALDAGVAAGIPDYRMMHGATEASLSAEDRSYLTQLMDPSPEVREEAAASIEPTGIALDHLASIVTTDPSPEVRTAAAVTLEDSKDPKAFEALIMALQDKNPEVLVEVMSALTYIENRRALPYLQPFLDHPDEDVRDAAESSIDSFN